MKAERLAIADVVLLTPARYPDSRGFFSETWNERRFAEAGIPGPFVQDNHSYSAPRGTVRGLHARIAPNVQSEPSLAACPNFRVHLTPRGRVPQTVVS